MKNNKRKRGKLLVNVGTIGHLDHGKTTLTAALTKVGSSMFGGKSREYKEIHKATEYNTPGIFIPAAHVKYESANRKYSHIDCPGHADYVKNMITGTAQMDGAILVCAANEGLMPQTREHLVLAKQLGVEHIIVFINKADLAAQDILIQVEEDVRSLLNKYDYPGNDISVIHGSSTLALNGDQGEFGEPAILKLMRAMDQDIPEPKCDRQKDFLMPVENVYSIFGRGTVAAGKIESGVINIGDEVEIVGINPSFKTTITGIESERKHLDQAEVGAVVNLLLLGTNRDQVMRGQVISKPDTLETHKQFKATVYVLKKDEGGRDKPFFDGYQSNFYFRGCEISGTCTFPHGVEMALPGDNVDMIITLDSPVAMIEGQRFVISEKVRTIGAGMVSRIIE